MGGGGGGRGAKERAGGRSGGEDGSERRRWYGGEPAMNDRNQRNTAPRKLPGIHPEYIIHTGVPGAASTSLGQGVAYSGTDVAPEEEKRAREEPHDRPRRCASRGGTRESREAAFTPRPPRIISATLLLIVRPIASDAIVRIWSVPLSMHNLTRISFPHTAQIITR